MFIFRRLLLKNFKFVYKLSQRLRYRFTSAGVLIASGMLASGVFGVDIRQSMAFQIFTIMASLLLASFLYSLSFRGQFKITRELPQFGTVHQTMRYRITVHNLGKLAQNDLLLIDDLETYFPKYEEFNKSRDPQDKNRNRFDRVIGYPRLVALIQKLRGGTIQADVCNVVTREI